jgi:hypothetical protein
MLLPVYPSRIANAAQGAGSAAIYTKTAPAEGGFSMCFCSEALSAHLSGFSCRGYKYPTPARFARSWLPGALRICLSAYTPD